MKVSGVAGGNGQSVSEFGGGDQTILDRHASPLGSQARQQPGPFGGGGRIEVQDAHPLHTGLKPLSQACAATPSGQQQNAIFEFTEDDCD